MRKWLSNIGPGTLIAAAFIGPGTVTTCMVAGVHYGFDLLWAMVFSIIATIILQEMSARIGLVTQKGISEIIRTGPFKKFMKIILGFLILSAIVIGNAAYEAGNISGALLGVGAILPDTTESSSFNPVSLVIGGLAFFLLFSGNYKMIEKWLIGMVILLSIAFIAAAIATGPSVVEIVKGMFWPSLPSTSILTVMAIVGTTVVPYNLFLHASLVKRKWHHTSSLSAVRKDLYISILLGGIVSIMIIVAAASLHGTDVSVSNGLDMALSLEPVLGSYARYLIGIGLFAAGVTSAITAPLAAAYVATEMLDLDTDMKSLPFRSIWIAILLFGVLLSSFGWKPIEIINYAQLTNGILLPVIACILLWMVNQRNIMKHHRNSMWQNLIGFIILAVTLTLGTKSVMSVFGMSF